MIRSERAGRAVVYAQALGVGLAYVLAIVIMDTLYVHKHIADRGLSLGYAFVLVEGGVIGSMLLLSMVLKFVRNRRDQMWLRLHPVIASQASAYLAGSGLAASVVTLAERHPREVERCIAELLLCVHGTARTRVSTLAGELGLVARWTRQYRARNAANRRDAISRLGQLDDSAGAATLLQALADPNDEVKLEASRALIRGGGRAELAAVFRTAVRESLLVRAVLTESLRSHALLLCEDMVPEALASPDARTVRTALEIVRAWGKSMPLERLETLLVHADAGVRAAALAIVPQLLNPRACEPEVLGALADPDEAVRAAAAGVAGKLRLDSALAPLERCLCDDGPDATVAAAYALAAIGPEGCRILERQVLASRTLSACAALEALERARSARDIVVPA